MSPKLSALFLFSLLAFSALAEDDDVITPSTTEASSTEAPCEDDPNTNCDQFKNLCGNDKYAPLLKTFCPVTCNFCPGATTVSTTPAPNCSDMSSNCVNWVKNGFCTNSFYKCADRIKYCQKSCKLCNTSSCKDPTV